MSKGTSESELKQKAPAGPDLSVASELIRARAERGFSQAQLSDLSGISRSTVKAYETGRNMPGSRELRALCVALNVTPNRLLFGNEAPVLAPSESAKIDAALRSDPEEKAASRMRLAMVATMLAEDEFQAVQLLTRSLAVARHGAERVEQALLASDFMTGTSRAMLALSAKASVDGKKVDPAAFVSELEQSLQRLGNRPKGVPPETT